MKRKDIKIGKVGLLDNDHVFDYIKVNGVYFLVSGAPFASTESAKLEVCEGCVVAPSCHTNCEKVWKKFNKQADKMDRWIEERKMNHKRKCLTKKELMGIFKKYRMDLFINPPQGVLS